MQVERYQTAADFLEAQREALETSEVVNSVLLGIALRVAQIERGERRGSAEAYWAAVRDGARPVVMAGMTPPYHLLLAGDEQPGEAAVDLLTTDLAIARHPVPGANGPERLSTAFATSWAQLVGGPVRRGMHQRVYELRDVQHPAYSPGALRLAEPGDTQLLADWRRAFEMEALGHIESPDIDELELQRIEAQEAYIWEVDGRPVSTAGRSRPTAHGVTINRVYTPPPLRGRGYATSCVAALSQRMLDQGYKFCTLFTDLANPTSNSIYQQIGYRPVCDFRDYIFGERP